MTLSSPRMTRLSLFAFLPCDSLVTVLRYEFSIIPRQKQPSHSQYTRTWVNDCPLRRLIVTNLPIATSALARHCPQRYVIIAIYIIIIMMIHFDATVAYLHRKPSRSSMTAKDGMMLTYNQNVVTANVCCRTTTSSCTLGSNTIPLITISDSEQAIKYRYCRWPAVRS